MCWDKYKMYVYMILKKWLSIPITVQSTTQQNWKQVNKQKALKIAPVNKKKIESFQQGWLKLLW